MKLYRWGKTIRHCSDLLVLNVRMVTKINVEQDGKFVSLTDKLSNQSV